ncbi:LacI family transcription regulator [Knoellia sinensis KCTC 19936]|uniref:LacI family transcription regulator n=1 Tax=Knoellia sinensis KCTC 19936 TaxID=1385520 RepID=A0A0A0JC41_9MICO|nr:substrate-binding domain-containing protein [Knoellia sinensis]KGN34748.1 LacI family transcription regulator [Knoellia sinensis KCTC 19936]
MPPSRQTRTAPSPTVPPRTGQARKVTLRDVADRAAVSISTASLVFSGKGPVAPETAARVRDAAGELGYAGPDPLAASLRQGKARSVAVIVEDRLIHAFRDPFALAVLDGVAQELDAMGTSMLLVADHGDGRRGALESHAVDAAIFPLCGRSDSPLTDHLVARGLPIVGTGAPSHDSVVHVVVDERGASAQATRHLVDLGHTRLAHVAMPLTAEAQNSGTTRRVEISALDSAAYADARERAHGFLEVAASGSPLVEAHRADVTEGEKAGLLLLDAPPEQRPTGIVAQSDLLAAGVIRAAEALGLRVPEDLSVTGFDAVDLPWLDRELTTIVQPGEAKGRLLGDLTRRILSGEQPGDAAFPVTLRVGDTTAPPPTG